VKDQLLRFVDAVRGTGIAVTVAETLDATRAVAAAGLDRNVFREALAATLIKDEADRSTFDEVFESFFATPPHHFPKKKQRRPEGVEPGGGGSASNRHEHSQRERRDQPPPESAARPRATQEHQRAPFAGQRPAHQRALERRPLQELSSREIEESELLVAALAQRLRRRFSRRQRAARRGRIDLRRTLRGAASVGGIPIDPAFRRQRPRRPDLLALCDHSHSVAIASQFLIGLLLPSAMFFKRVHLFAFVDRPVEVSIEAGCLVPHTLLDLYARSDFGRVLVELREDYRSLITRNTRVLILGDARNNRRPPRADLLAKLHTAAAQVVWVNPEPNRRWNTGDSVMNLYARHCDHVMAAGSLRELAAALDRSIVRT